MSKRESSIERRERLLAGCAPTRLSPAAVDELARRWRATFARRVREATGEWTHFGWTMVFTHEADWCGPYFTTAEWAKAPPPSTS